MRKVAYTKPSIRAWLDLIGFSNNSVVYLHAFCFQCLATLNLIKAWWSRIRELIDKYSYSYFDIAKPFDFRVHFTGTWLNCPNKCCDDWSVSPARARITVTSHEVWQTWSVWQYFVWVLFIDRLHFHWRLARSCLLVPLTNCIVNLKRKCEFANSQPQPGSVGSVE